MKIIEEYKEFLEYRKFLSQFQEIDTSEIKKNLSTLGYNKELYNKLFEAVKQHLNNSILREDKPQDFIKWAKYTLAHLMSYFK